MTILCEPSAERVESLAGHIEGGVLRVDAITSLNDALAANPSETVVVLGAGVELEQALEFTLWLRQHRPLVRVVLLRENLRVDDLTAAMRAGVREVLLADDPVALSEACRRYEQVFGSAPSATAAGSPRGQVITVFAAKGGCGKTTVATNVAVTLNRAGQRVCLVDLDLAFGDVAITLQLTPIHSIVDVAALGGNLDEEQVSSLLTPHLPGLDCILAPVVPGDSERVPATLTAALIDVLAGMYEYVVIDTPAQITEHVLAALDASDQHILLTTPEIPALKNLRLTLDMLDLLAYGDRARTIILNRSDEKVGLSEEDIERAVRSPISGRIPSSRDVPISINRGITLAAQSPDHPVSVAFRRFVASHVHHALEPSPSGRAPRSGLRFRRRSS